MKSTPVGAPNESGSAIFSGDGDLDRSLLFGSKCATGDLPVTCVELSLRGIRFLLRLASCISLDSCRCLTRYVLTTSKSFSPILKNRFIDKLVSDTIWHAALLRVV